MNKKLIALAVTTALAAPLAAHAEATVYGQANVSIESYDDGGTNANKGLNAFSNNSRLGFKGSEDLGGGMSAVYQVETSVDMTGTFGTTLRNTYVGLSGGFGTVVVGRHDTPYKKSTDNVDPFGDTSADYNSIMGADLGAVNTDGRVSDVIGYMNSFGDTSVFLAYVPEADDDGVDESIVSFNVKYNQGPLFLGLGYVTAGDATGTNVKATALDATGTRIGAGYTMGDTKLGFAYETLNVTSQSGSAVDADQTNMYFSVAQKMGDNTLALGYGIADPDTDDNNATFLALGVSHAYSENTSVYANYAAISNEAGSGYGLGGPAGLSLSANANDDDLSTIAFGIKHKF